MKDAIWRLLVWAGIIGLFTLVPYSCDRVQRTHTEAKKQRAENELAEFCKANNAVPALKGLPGSNLLKIDLQRSLFVKEKRVAFRAQLSDMARIKGGEMSAVFTVSYSGAEIDAYLKCTESEAQKLHDDYHRDKDSTFLIAAEFGEIEAQTNSDSGSDYKKAYHAIGTLVGCAVAKYKDSNSDSKSDSDDSD